MEYFPKVHKYKLFILILGIVLVQMILVLQGFDVCDDGFVLTFYQQFFNDSRSVEYNFVYWFSGLVGGLWYELNPSGGIFWFKIFTVLINTTSFILFYFVFKNLIPKSVIILGLLVSLFINDFGFLIYYHNNLTVLLIALSVLFLLKGIFEGKNLFIVLSGLILGLNIFTRITNITLMSFVLAIPFYYFLSVKDLKKSINPMVFYFLGLLLGLGIVFLLLLGLGQFIIMKDALISLYHLGVEKNSTHNFIDLITIYLKQIKDVIQVFGQLLIIIIFFYILLNSFKKYRWTKFLLLCFLGCFAFLIFKGNNVFSVYALGYLGVFVTLFSFNSPKIKTVSLLGFLMLTFLPIGSGDAILSCGYISVWLAIPFFFYIFYKLKTISLKFDTSLFNVNVVVPESHNKFFIVFIAFTFFSAKAYNISRNAYFDPGSRLEKTFVINNEFAKGVYTTERRAVIINDLLENLKPYVKPDDYLLVFDKTPMLHFLTQTKPYMYNSWVWIYDSYNFKEKLLKAEKERNVFPIIVVQKFNTIGSFSEPIPDYFEKHLINTEGITNEYDLSLKMEMNSFLERNDYKVVWSNAYFNILKTNKKHS